MRKTKGETKKRKTFVDGIELDCQEKWDELERKYGCGLINYIGKVEIMFYENFEPITRNYEGHVIEVRY